MERAKHRMNWRRMLLPAAALVVGFGLGIAAGLILAKENENALLKEVAVSGTPSVLPDTVMRRQYRFALCEHIITASIDTNAFVGYTKKELERFYSPDEVRFDGDSSVIVTHQVDGCCPMHYLLRADETGRLCVYRTDADLFTTELMQRLSIDGEESPYGDDHANLQQGMVFDTLAEIDAYLESLES